MANEGRGTSTLEGSPKGSGAASEAPLPFPLPSSYIFVGGTNPVAGVNPTRVSLHNVCGLYTNAVNRSRRLVDHRASITAAGNEGLPHALREPWPGESRVTPPRSLLAPRTGEHSFTKHLYGSLQNCVAVHYFIESQRAIYCWHSRAPRFGRRPCVHLVSTGSFSPSTPHTIPYASAQRLAIIRCRLQHCVS